MRNIKDQMDLFGNQDDIPVKEIMPEDMLTEPLPDSNAPEYQQMRKAFAIDALKGAVTSPITGTADIVEMGAALPDPSPSTQLASPTYAAIEEAFDQLSNLGINRANAEKLIKDATGLELKGTAGELTGEIVGLPLAAATNAATSVLKAATKYGDKAAEYIGDIGEEAGELFRKASGGDGTDGMAMATASASRETVPTGVKPDLPDTSVSPMMIGVSTPRGQRYVEDYNRAKDFDPDLSEEDLFAQTGVYKGPDGKFRSELPTTDATINTDVFEKLKSGDTTETTLEELVDFPDLFNAYREEYYDAYDLDFVTPSDLGNIKIKISKDDDFAGAYYSNYRDEGELIVIDGRLDPNELRSTLLHEVQHAIQRREGFTSGANTDMFYPTVSEDLGLGKISKSRYLSDIKRVNSTLQDSEQMIFKPFKNIAKSLFGDKADLTRPLRNFDLEEQFLLTEVIPNIALDRHKRQKFSRFGISTPRDTYKITKEDVAKYFQDERNLYDFKTEYLNVPNDKILDDVSPEVIENFVNKAGKVLSNPKLTPELLKSNLHKKVNTMKERDLLFELPNRARLEYKRKYGELESSLIEKRDSRRQALRQLTDMSDSEIEAQMREEFPPLAMEIEENIARANPQFMKGLTAKDGKVQVPPEKARLDDDSPIAFSASARPDVDETVDTMTAAGLDDVSIADWRKANATSEEFRKRLKGRNPILMQLAEARKANEITAQEYREAADAFRPIRTVEQVPEPATTTEVVSALGKKSEKGVVGVNRNIPEGDRITARLDINAYTDYDVWIPTLTHPEKKTVYSPTVVLRDVSFIQPDSPAVKKAMNVATGQAKAPFAVMEGNYRSMSDSDAFEYAKQAFDDESWTQVGYDPTRRGFFYDRKTGEPVLNAEEVVQVGHLVLAKNAVKGDADDFPFNKGGAVPMKRQMELFEPVERGFNEGGLLQEGGSVDPVSGNEVPVGSLQEEVRDDIPAQLSEGEFVMPADVVRYHGLDKMMELRDEAKAGLARMDAMGQMGNSEEAVIPEGIPFDAGNIPFSLDDLELEDDGVAEYQVGGFVPGTQQVASSFPASQTGVTTPAAPVTAAGQFAQLQTSSPYAISQAPAQSTQPTVTAQQLIPQTEVRQYINDDGQMVSIAFANGQPVTPIPEGFKPYTGQSTAPKAAPVASAPPAPQVDTGGDDDQQGGGFGSGATAVFGGTSRDGKIYGGTTYEVSYGRSGEGGGIPLPGLLGLATGNYDRVTLTDAQGKKATMSRDLYSTLKEDRTGQQTQDIIKDLFQNTEAAERSIRESGQLDKGFLGTGFGGNRQEIENAAAKAIYDDLGIDYKGQPLSEALLVQQQAGEAGKRATPAPVTTPGVDAPADVTTTSTTPRTAQDDIVAESFPVTTGTASIERKPISEIVGTMERVDAPTSAIVENVPVETATINPFGRGDMTYAKNELTGDWVQISGEVGQIGRTAPALQAAMMNNPDNDLVTRGTVDVPRETGERIALPKSRPERPEPSFVRPDIPRQTEEERRDEEAAEQEGGTAFTRDTSIPRQTAAERADEEAAEQEGGSAFDDYGKAFDSNFSAAKSRGFSDDAARNYAANKTDGDREAQEQTGDSRTTAVTSRDGTPVRSSSGRVVTNTPPDDDGDSGGGKIVCTAMNNAYGFGSFRQTIWLKHSKGLDPAYQKGYHRIFKPLIRFAYSDKKWYNIAVRKTLEGIARRRTADIWMQQRGKRHPIGAIERAILEPICYIVGKIK